MRENIDDSPSSSTTNQPLKQNASGESYNPVSNQGLHHTQLEISKMTKKQIQILANDIQKTQKYIDDMIQLVGMRYNPIDASIG